MSHRAPTRSTTNSWSSLTLSIIYIKVQPKVSCVCACIRVCTQDWAPLNISRHYRDSTLLRNVQIHTHTHTTSASAADAGVCGCWWVGFVCASRQLRHWAHTAQICASVRVLLCSNQCRNPDLAHTKRTQKTLTFELESNAGTQVRISISAGRSRVWFLGGCCAAKCRTTRWRSLGVMMPNRICGRMRTASIRRAKNIRTMPRRP